MRLTIEKRFFLLSFALFVLALDATELPGGLKFAQQTWNWAVVEWRGETLTSDKKYLTRFLPEVFARGFNEAPKHRLSEAEKKAIRDKLRRAALLNVDKEISQIVIKQNDLLLTSVDSDSSIDSLQKELTSWQSKRKEIEAVQEEQIVLSQELFFRQVVPDSKKKGGKEKENTVLKRTAGDQFLSKALKVDYLFTGTVSEVGEGYLRIEIELYSGVEDRVMQVWQDVFATDEASKRLSLACDAFKELFLGRPWASLSIQTEPSSAWIFLDAQQTKITPYQNAFLEPTSFTVKIKAAGHVERTELIELKPMTETTFVWKLKKDDKPQVSIQSEPQGAKIWFNSQLIGTTPLQIPVPLFPGQLRLKLKDHQEVTEKLYPSGPLEHFFTLPKEKIGFTLQEAKDRFYLSLGCFSFSLASTVFLWAFSNQFFVMSAYYEAYYKGSSDSLDRGSIGRNWGNASSIQQGLQWGYYGGVALTSGIFVWMMVELIFYLITAEKES